MARTTLTPVAPTRAGIDIASTGASMTAATTQMQFENTGKELLIVHTGGTATNMTQTIYATVDGKAVTNPATALGATVSRIFGPYPSCYTQADGYVYIDFDTVTNVKVEVIRLPGV